MSFINFIIYVWFVENEEIDYGYAANLGEAYSQPFYELRMWIKKKKFQMQWNTLPILSSLILFLEVWYERNVKH